MFAKINVANVTEMLQNLQNFATFAKFQLDNLVDFEKFCKTRISLQRSVPIQPKTSEILPKFCQNLQHFRAGAAAAGAVADWSAAVLSVPITCDFVFLKFSK